MVQGISDNILYGNVKSFLARFDEKSYQMGFDKTFVQRELANINQYEAHVKNDESFKKSNSVDFLVKRLYAFTTGRHYKRKTLWSENSRQLLINLANSAVLLLLMSKFKVRFANVSASVLETPYVPDLTRGVDELLNLWPDFTFPQHVVYAPNNGGYFRNTTFYKIDIKNYFMLQKYGILKLLLAAQFSEIRWDNAKKIDTVQTIFDKITLENGEVDITMLAKILQFLTTCNNNILQNIDDDNIVQTQRRIIRTFANNNILELKTMPQSMWESIIIANFNKKVGGRKK